MHTMPISGGRVVDIPFGPGGPRPGRANGFEVAMATITPSTAENEIIYQFGLTAPPAAALQSVQVEDITDDKPYLFVDDQHPWLTENRWHAVSKPLAAGDPRLAWIYQVTPAVRIYRFTLIEASGRRSVLYQVTAYPEFIKVTVRRKWGEKY